jgi:hypothetical protein
MIGDNAIKLHLPKTMRIHPVVNISRVRPYKEPLEGQTSIRPGPVKVTEDREIKYEVAHIVNVRKRVSIWNTMSIGKGTWMKITPGNPRVI